VEQVQPQRRQLAGVGGRIGPGLLFDDRQPLPPPALGLVELPGPLVGGAGVADDPGGVFVLEPPPGDAGRRLLEEGDGLGHLPDD
jgi:hypothetical protein